MKAYKFTINGNDYEVEINEIEDNLAKIEVNGTPYEIELHREVKRSKTPTLLRPAVPEPQNKNIERKAGGHKTPLTAPLPGSILQVFVKPGDQVKKEQKLVLMEAMKMENTVLAEKDCVIESVKVAPGDTVLQGDVLIETA
ncbi:MAG TPA: biotin/lipoyl-containing protein [Bacteroidales bacterium]|nr:biotin/lipoyl-containing protein [Bacteroidales bacterium]